MCSRKTVNIKKKIQCTLWYLSLVFFWVGNFDARYFFGSKISVLCIFLGLQYEAPSDLPRHVYFKYPPGHRNLISGNVEMFKNVENRLKIYF